MKQTNQRMNIDPHIHSFIVEFTKSESRREIEISPLVIS